jgi:hypothetical protein
LNRSVWIGWDAREASAFAVCRHSLRRRTLTPIPVHGLVLSDLRAKGLYSRPTSRRDGKLWDDISGAPMATEFAVSRFLVKRLARSGWALFMDCDMLVRASVERLFDACDSTKAIMCVKHVHEPPEGEKMDGQAQLRYARKNWSSVMAINCDHPANRVLTVEMVNSLPGRDLHRFSWLEDDLIGELDPAWNYLVGHSSPKINPKIVHFTEGGPWFPGYESVEYGDEWTAELNRWAA